MSSKKSRKKTVIRATTAAESTSSTKKGKLSPVGLKVLNDRLLIKPNPPDKYDGNLIIPDAYKAFYENLPSSGRIVSVGDKCKYFWNIGDSVRFAKMAGARLKFRGQDYLIVREYDVDALDEAVS